MQKLMKWAALIGGTFIIVSMVIVVYLGQDKVVVIADTGSNLKIEEISTAGITGEISGLPILLGESQDDTASFRIPVEASIGPDNISVENRPDERKLIIFLRGATGVYYKSNKITGYTEAIQEALYQVQEEGVILYIQFSKVYEYESILETGYLQFNLYKPEERYEKIVLLDAEIPEKLDGREREVIYGIEEKLIPMLQAEGIRVYTASGRGKELTIEEKQNLLKETNAGIYLGITLAEDSDKEQFGSYVCYNGTYFRPTITNGTLADLMERELVTEINGKAKGLKDSDEGILGELSIPAVIVCPGYVTHETEGRLLQQEGYQEKIASGICNGVLKIYETMGQGNE